MRESRHTHSLDSNSGYSHTNMPVSCRPLWRREAIFLARSSSLTISPVGATMAPFALLDVQRTKGQSQA